jgi:hypothetical protein
MDPNSKPVGNPVVGIAMSAAVEPATTERETVVERFDDAESAMQYVRSVPDCLLMIPSNEIMTAAGSVLCLQVVMSFMVVFSQLQKKGGGNASIENIISYVGSSVAIMASVNNNAREFYINNHCLKKLIARNPEDINLFRINILFGGYTLCQILLCVATVVSISQQEDPVGVITNCTGLLLIQSLDSQIFACLQIPAVASKKVKEVLKEVSKDPKNNSRKLFYFGCFTLFLITVLCSMLLNDSSTDSEPTHQPTSAPV